MTEQNDGPTEPAGKPVTRRRLLRQGAAATSLLALPTLLAACGDDAPSGGSGATTADKGASGSVTFASNGGALQDAQTRAWLDPYVKANPGVKIVQDVGSTDYARIEAMVRSGNVTWDLVDVGGDFGLGAQQDLLEPFDCDVVRCTTEGGGNNYRIPLHTYAAVIGYRAGETPSAPKGWADFFDLDAIPGKRGIFKVSGPTGLYESALLADGVAIEDLYPLDVDRAFKKLDTIKSEIVWSPSPTDTVKQLADGEVVLAQVFASQAFAVSQDGTKIDVVWDEAGIGGDYLVIPKGSKNKEAAMRLAAYITSPEHNAEISNIYPVGPGNPASRPDESAPTYPYLPSGKRGATFAFDSSYYAENQRMLAQRFDEWLQS